MVKSSSNRVLRNLSRAAWLVTGWILFLWIGYEDRSLLGVMGCAGLICASAGLTAGARFTGEGNRKRGRNPVCIALLGALFGGGVGPLAALLIAVKVGLHSHPVPDFAAGDTLQALALTPAWAIAGGLLGLALGVSLRLTGAGIER
jgi:hypothetical protein